MKKLQKLTLNEMRDFTPLSPQEQMSMKGGNWGSFFRLIPLAWEASKSIYNYITGSGSTSQGASSGGSGSVIRIYSPDSVRLSDGTVIYYPDSLVTGSGY